MHICRRTMLQLMAGACIANPAISAPTQKIIDIHQHFLPAFYAKAVKHWLDAGFASPAVSSWQASKTIAAMDSADVALSFLSISSPGFAFAHGHAAGRAARACNDEAAQLCRDYPGRFRFFAALPMPDVSQSLDVLARARQTPGFAGAGLLTNYNGHYLGDPAFVPLLEELDRNGDIVFVHPTEAPCCRNLLPDVPMPSVVEFAADTARTITSLLWAGLLSRFGRIRFIFTHGGGALPMILGREQVVPSTFGIGPRLAARVPEGVEAALGKLYVDTASVTNRAGIAALRAWLPDSQILFGSDFPYAPLERSIGGLERLALEPSTRGAIMAGNARRLFDMGPQS